MLPLAASVTVTHTLGVIALGLLVTAGSAATPSVIAWLGIASGALVLFAGANLVRRAWRNRPRPHATSLAHPHPHPHPHPHDHDHGHRDGHGHGHETAKVPERALVLVSAHAEAGAPTRRPTHTRTRTAMTTTTPTATSTGTTTPILTPHDHAVEHTHGGFTHTHETAPTVRGTILLGFAGGLVPSPSAVVVLVGPPRSARRGSGCCSSSRTASVSPSPSPRPDSPSSSWVQG